MQKDTCSSEVRFDQLLLKFESGHHHKHLSLLKKLKEPHQQMHQILDQIFALYIDNIILSNTIPKADQEEESKELGLPGQAALFFK